MKIISRTSILFYLLIPALVFACPDLNYEKQLSELQALTKEVTVENPSPESLKKYFRAMPSTFSCFNHLYGFNQKPAPLYEEPILHFLFPKMQKVVSKKAYIDKLISLAVNARWEADQTGGLQRAVHNLLYSDTVLFIKTMEKYSQIDQESIWNFLFDGPHPSNRPIKPRIKKLICEISEFNCKTFQNIYSIKTSQELVH